MACVSKRRGKWVADFRDATGKRHWQSFDTKKKAEAALHAQATAISKGTFVAETQRTVADAYGSWTRLCVEGSQNKSGKPLRCTTAALYSQIWRVRVSGQWGAVKLKDVTKHALKEWTQELVNAGVGAKSVRNGLGLLNSIYVHAIDNGWTARNPVTGVHRPAYDPKVRALTAQEIRALIAHADETTGLLIRLLASCGLRIGEAFGAQWGDVSLDAGQLRIVRQYTHGHWSEPKSKRGKRVVPLSADLVQRLRVWRDALDTKVVRLPGTHDDRLLFPASDGKPQLYHNWFHRKWQPLCKRAGVAGHPHQLRHAYATMLIQAGESAATVSELIGHANGAFTMKIYADSWAPAVAAAGEKVHGLLFPPTGSTAVANPPRGGQVIEFSGGADDDQKDAHQLPPSSTWPVSASTRTFHTRCSDINRIS